MADLVKTSFETGAIADIFTGGVGAGVTYSAVNPHTGAQHVRAAISASADTKINLPGGVRTLTLRYWIFLSALPSATSRLFTLDGSNGVSRIQMNTSGSISTNIGGTGGTAAGTLAINTWTAIDCAFDSSSTTYSFSVRVAGGTSQQQTKTLQTAADVTDIDFWSTWTGATNFDIDDLHITDSTSDYPLADFIDPPPRRYNIIPRSVMRASVM